MQIVSTISNELTLDVSVHCCRPFSKCCSDHCCCGQSILLRSCISRLAAFSGNGDLIWRQSPWGARLWWKFDLETWNRNEKQQHPGSPPLYACHGFRGEFFDMVFVYTKKWSIWMWDLPMSLFDLYVHIAVVYSVHARTHLYTYSLLPNNPKMKKIWDI